MKNNEEIKAYLKACELMGIKTHKASSEEKRKGIVILAENGEKYLMDRDMKKMHITQELELGEEQQVEI